MSRALFRLAPLALILTLVACGPEVAAPSLMPRPVEKQPIGLPEAAREPESAVDPALTQRITALLARVEAADAAFQKQREETAMLVERGASAGTGSEAWIAAQQSLSALETMRGPVRDASGEIEALRQEPANAVTGNRAAIEAAATRIEGIGEAQATALAALSARLG